MAKENKRFIEALEDEATEQLGELRRFRINQSKDNADGRVRAKLAIGLIGSYVRLRATMANEKSNELIEKRLLGGGERPALPSAE